METRDLDEQLRYIPKRDYAGLFRRGLAFLIDSIIILMIDGAIYATLRMLLGLDIRALDWYVDRTVDLLIAFLYFTFLDSNLRAGSIGKQAMSMQVVDGDGEPLVLKRSAARSAMKVCFAVVPLFWIIPAFTKYRQGLHDLIADTYVMED